MVRVYHICLSIHLWLSSWTLGLLPTFVCCEHRSTISPILKEYIRCYGNREGPEEADALELTENEETFSIQTTEGKCLWGGAGVYAHWKQAGHGALGESTHDLSVEGVSMLGLSAGQVGGEELPTTLCVMVYSLLQDPALVPVEGPKLSVNRNITCRHGRWQDQITNHSAISQVPLPPLP